MKGQAITPNWVNRTIWEGDNLDIMRGMNSESVDLVYLDPPFNSNRNYAAPIGSKAAGAAFKDTWTLNDIDIAWHGELADREPGVHAAIGGAGIVHGKGMQAYLTMMAMRLLEIRRVMKSTASVYLHCDPTAGAYLRILMDGVFGPKHFRNEIVWRKYAGVKNNAKRKWPTEQDTLLFYASPEATLTPAYNDLATNYAKRFDQKDETGRRYMDTWGRNYQRDGTRKRLYLDECQGSRIGTLWTDGGLTLNTSSRERVGYPTQKPLALLDRIISASSNPGDMVLDPFCGCATTCVSAERLDRQWAGIDLSPKAAELVKARLSREIGTDGLFDRVIVRTDIPHRTDRGPAPPFRTHKHKLFGQQEGTCAGCRMSFPFRNLTVDHIVPKVKGGGDDFENLQLLCGACNSMKGSGTHEELLAKLKLQRVA